MENKAIVDQALYHKFLAAVDPGHLDIRLFATEKCNFRCTYCYEDFELGRMSREVRNGVKNLLRRRAEAGLRSLYIGWFGGEPLMAMEVIDEIEPFKLSLRERFPDLHIHPSSITTNGYLLTPDILKRLTDYGVREYQITLDGSESQHNRTRLRADGAGTYEQIMRNLEAAAASDYDFNMTLRLHLHADNIVDQQTNLLPQLIEKFGRDPRFQLHPISIGNYGGAYEVNQMRGAGRQAVDAAMANILGRFAAARRTVSPPPTAPAAPSERAHDEVSVGIELDVKATGESGMEVCYAAKSNSFSIRADGNIVKCTTALDDPHNQIGRILESGDLELKPELIKMWLTGFVTGKPGELSCPMYAVKKMPMPDGKKFIPIHAMAA